MGGDGKFAVDLGDEVIRGSLVVHKGKVLPPVRPAMPTPAAPPATPAKGESQAETLAITPWQKATRDVALVTTGMASTVGLGKLTGVAFMNQCFTFGLAGLVGYRVVWNVAPALHSPLMSVTNAISGKWLFSCAARYSLTCWVGMVGIGGLFVMGGGYFPHTLPQALGSLSVLLASVNVAGGFIITKRMLDMFKR